ncbi:MAG: hypothetical protein DWQ37_14030 [Planctomycetota bacterium]|nr:MAG: hypothetical protein DWQ37_14030 [Planctomycetota bacterium]
MSTDSQHASTRSGSRPAELVEFEEFIEGQLHKTRNQVRGVDIATSVMVLVAGTLGFFLFAVLVDHWASGGGLNFWGRLFLLAIYVAGATWWITTQIVPLVVKRINPLYAAATIERSRPTLKNALVNFLLFRANPSGVHSKVYAAIEEQAATNLASVEVESAVDRSRLIRLGYVLVGLLLVAALYTFLSPKDLFQSVGRVAMPWADIGPATQTTIEDVTPGDAEAFRGQRVAVSAHVDGLPDDGAVMLYYSTADRQIVDRAVEMTPVPDGYQQYAAKIPAGGAALQQSLSYRIEAGDAVTRNYAIDVVSAPTIVVESLEYHYPEYTKLLTQRVEHQGDIKAIEGTKIVLTALANQDIATAHVDFDCDQTLDQRMRIEGHRATATFRLVLDQQRQGPEHSSYQVVFKNPEGQSNPQPLRHRIEVTRDLAPEIQFVQPKRDSIDVPQNASVDLEVVANDPDFALSRVMLSARRGGKNVVDTPLLEETWRGQFVKKYRFRPQKLGLEAGDVIEYWATAADNKSPNANVTETARRRLRIISPESGENAQDQLAQNDPQQDDSLQRDGDAGDQGQRDPRNASQQPDDPRDEQQREPPSPEGQEPQEGEPGGEGQQGDDGQQDAGQGGGEQGQQPGEQADQNDQAGDGQEAGGESGDGEQGNRGGEARDRGEGGTQGESGDGQQGGTDEGVPSDGTSDGDAFDRILQHRDQQRDAADDSSDRGQQGNYDDRGQQRDQQQREQRGDDGQQRESSSDQRDPDRQQDQQRGDQGEPGDNARGQRPDTDRSDQQRGEPGEGDSSQQRRDGGQEAQGQQGREQQGERGQDRGQQQPGENQEQPGGQQGTPEGSRQGDENASQRGSEPGDRQQGQEPTGQEQQAGGDKSGDQDRQASDESGQGQTGEQREAGDRRGDPDNAQRQQGGGDEGSETQPSEQPGPKEQDPRAGGTRDNNTRPDGSPQDPATQGQGGQSKDDPTRSPDQQPAQDGEQRPDARGGDGQQEKGESGAGQSTNENKGSPAPQEQSRPRRKSQQPGGEPSESTRDNQQEQSPSQSKHESDSEGQEDGDRSGGGQRGGGQKSNKPGTGGAGQNTAADEGAGQSEQAGDGESSDRAGDDRQSDQKTGRSGNQQGEGSRQGASEDNPMGGAPQGDNTSQQASDDSASSEGSSSDANQGSPGSGSAGDDPTGGRGQAQQPPPKREWKPSEDVSDDANLDYAKKATDLALDHLKNELAKDQPDQDLLDNLGWTRQEAEQFVKRWESMRQKARAEGPQTGGARRELDETLRSLGLRPQGSALSSNSARDDQSRGYKESRRTAPPPEYSEAFKAYTQGTARSGK